MKKLFLFLPLLVAPLLTGCQGENSLTQLTYGTIKDNEAIQLSSSDFTTHFENNENFLLAIYPRDSKCSCWSYFSEVINTAMIEEHLLIYKYCAQDVADNASMKEIGGFSDRLDAPTFYIIKEKKIAKAFNYSTTANFFKEEKAFYEELQKYIKLPKLIYISLEQIISKVNNDESLMVFYARNKCSDCNYVIPHTITPYFDSLTVTKNDVYVFDMQEYYGTPSYQTIKDTFLLSEKENKDLGFGEGVVPTFQYYQEGDLTDMCIYVNEGALTYSSEEDCYYASNAYYNETRLSKLHYLDNVENKDLTKVKIAPSNTIEYKNNHYWDINSSSQFYDPILKAFFDKYL